MSIYVIINADDLGISLNVNKEIEWAMENGKITSSSILANTQYIDDVKRIVDRFPNCSFGVHLNLIEGESLTKNPILLKYGIVDKNYLFNRQIQQISTFTKELKEAIFEEWEAQIQRLLENNIEISHIDGHHHIHRLFGLENVLLRIKKLYKIKKNRTIGKIPLWWKIIKKHNGNNMKEVSVENLSSTLEIKDFKRSIFFRIKTLIFVRFQNLRWWWYISILGGSKMTHYFCSYEDLCDKLLKGYKLPKNSIIELMCHPGHRRYETEYELIKGERIKSIINDEVVYISYKQL